ncbi:MAG TPA: hypothetical protein VFI46_17185 [Jiangellaceae bacterium]|nr:hypothetical protein [Jiangellaceae bacterium]
MNLRRTLTVAAMHARDLGRRRLALAIVILLPMVFYFFYELQPVDPAMEQLLAENPTAAAAADMWVVATGAIGVGWAIAVAALFVMIGSRRADQSLLLAGYRPAELLVGRVLTVLGLTAVVTPLFAVVIWSQRELDLATLAAAIGLSGVVAATIGVLAAAIVPREMEGVLLIIGVIGIQMTADPQRWMPLWGAGELLARSAGLPDAASAGAAVTHALVFATALLAIGIAIWARRVKLRPPTRVLHVDSAGPLDDAEPARLAR